MSAKKFSDMSSVQQMTEYASLLGRFIGTVEGVMAWDIPAQLKERLKEQLTKLKEKEKLETNS